MELSPHTPVRRTPGFIFFNWGRPASYLYEGLRMVAPGSVS